MNTSDKLFGLKIWERYFLKEFCKIFFLFWACFCFLYILIDSSIHGRDLSQTPTGELFLYYLFEFLRKAEILGAFALLLSCIKVLLSLNGNNELIALLSSGVSLKRLLRPLWIPCILCCCFLYLNFEIFTPTILSKLQKIKDLDFSERVYQRSNDKIQYMPLSDGSKLLYQSYDPILEAFFDVYWIRSPDQILHIKHLFPHLKHPVGRYVDHLIRNTDKHFYLFESIEETTFNEMRFDAELLRVALNPPEQQSLSQLLKNLPKKSKNLSDKEAQTLSAFYYKSLIPLICLFCLLGPAPFCLRFSRSIPSFSIYSLAIFSLLSFFTLMDAAMILSDSQIFSPLFAIATPFVALGFATGIPYSRMQ